MTRSMMNIQESIDSCYPEGWAARLVKLHGPKAQVGSPGKQPMDRHWIRDADARSRQYESEGPEPRGRWISEVHRHVQAGGNVGLAISEGVVALDADDARAVEFLQRLAPSSAPRQQTARGTHLVFRLPSSERQPNRTGIALPGGGRLDVRGYGAQIVVAPSIHKTGSMYSWSLGLPTGGIAALPLIPLEILNLIRDPGERAGTWREEPQLGKPPFPLGAFPHWFQSAIRAGAKETDAPIELAAIPALAALGTALGPGWQVRAQSMKEAPRLWLVVVAPPGSSKSPTARPFLLPLEERDDLLAQDRASSEGFEKPNGRDSRRRPRACVSDITPEGLASALEYSPRGLLVHSDELKQLLVSLDGSQSRPGKGRAFLLAVWSGQRHAEVRKVAQESRVPNPFACVFGCLTEADLSGLDLANNDGLAARFLWSLPSCGEHGLGRPSNVDALWKPGIALASCHELRDPQELDTNACALVDARLRQWTAKAAKLDVAGAGLLAGMYGKAGTHLVRLTALLHGADRIEAALRSGHDLLEPAGVSLGTVERALLVMDYFLSEGTEAIRRLVLPPPDERATAVFDDALLQCLRKLLQLGEERSETPSGWAAQLALATASSPANCISPENIGRAFKRLREIGGHGFVFESSRGAERRWRIKRIGGVE